MLSTTQIDEALRTVLDPEMPINIVDLGIVADVRNAPDGAVEVDITPTFVGCPALDVLARDIVGTLRNAGAPDARVQFVNTPAWSVDRISAEGRENLRQHGVVVPPRGEAAQAADARRVPLLIRGAPPVECPYCRSENTRLESSFGPTRCRMIYYCDTCRNSFERLKPI